MLRPILGLVLVIGVGLVVKAAVAPTGLIAVGFVGSSVLVTFLLVWVYLVLRNDRHIVLPSIATMAGLLKRHPA
jgi:hypothetical protein